MADKKSVPEFDSDEQRDAYIAALEMELASVKARGHRRSKDVEVELARVRGASKQTRPRGAGAETRSAADG